MPAAVSVTGSALLFKSRDLDAVVVVSSEYTRRFRENVS